MARRLAPVLAAAVAAFGAAIAAAPATADQLRPVSLAGGADPALVDDLGREVLLRGVNVNQLAEYFQASPTDRTTIPLTEADADEIASLGLGVVRLLVSWSRLEPSPGAFDEAYVASVRQAVRWFGARDVRVVLDMHQDAWGPHVDTPDGEECAPGLSRSNGWDGAPRWATFTDGLTTCQIEQRELSPAVAQAWQSFWADRAGIQAALVATWGRLARALAAEPAVVGYDLLNEPNPGFTLGATNLAFLTAFYDRAIAAIRAGERAAGAPTRLAFFEPTVEWSLAGTTVLPPRPADPQVVFAPHLYSGSIGVLPVAEGFAAADQAARTYGTPIWSGEWGWFGEPAAEEAEVLEYTAAEDARAWGGAWWSWKQACGDPHVVHEPGGRPDAVSPSLHRYGCPGDVDLGIPVPFGRALSRPAPRAVPGRILELRSDPRTGAFALRGRDPSPDGSCTVDLWVPGTATPVVAAEGVTDLVAQQVPGGFRLTGCARGDYRISSDGPRGATVTAPAVCASRRVVRLTVPRVRGGRVTSVEVRVGGKLQRRYRGAPRHVRADLRGRARGRTRILLVVRATGGRRVAAARVFRTCTRRPAR